MDGIALSAGRTFGATETTPVTLAESDFFAVDTGDPLPPGCDCVVMIEDIVRENGRTLLFSAAAPWQHIRQIGEDICKGDMLLPSFTEITPACVGALIAGGVCEVRVIKKPLVGIIPTGDELVRPNAPRESGAIPEFNSAIFSGMLKNWEAVPKTYQITRDNPAEISKALEAAASECDIVLINAGSSAGSEDYSASAVAKLGRVLFHGIAIRPGKPAILGLIGKTPVVGVPGYPVSGIIVLEEIVRPLINEWYRTPPPYPQTAVATLARRINSSLKYREFVRARLGSINGRLVAVPLARGAGVVTSFVNADGIIEIPQNSEGNEAGDKVAVRLLKPLREIEEALVITGSHDPLIDEAADILCRESPGARTASSHVGSMGGIIAVKRGEAHMAGIHLLDEATGEYNKSYIKTHFPEGGALLHPCVRRVQGFIVKQGNPLNIGGFTDIAERNLSFVNRQKGSGTRILCDYLMKKDGIAPETIFGYEREEYTHTAVAAIVASGGADAGLGIYSASKIYGLDFVPVCEEEYDFLIDEKSVDNPAATGFLNVLASEEFRNRLEELGGYK